MSGDSDGVAVPKFGLVLGVLLILTQHCVAQSGYNYVRPEVTVGSSGVPATVVNPLRPIQNAFPTANTAFGAPTNLNPTTPFGSFPQRAVGSTTGFTTAAATAGGLPTAPTSYGGTTASGSLPKRPTVTQRPTSGIYGATGQQQFVGTARSGQTGTGSGIDADYDGDFSAIPGIPGVDYPIYSQVPQTNFDCAQQPLPGYYSDVEAQCQVFHICALNRTYSFLCPNGTVFSQETLVCVWWNQYDCNSSPSLYVNNAYIYDYGSERAPSTNVGFQGTQNQIGTRQPATFQATNPGRNQIASNTPFGSSSIRPNSGNFPNIIAPVTPVPSTAFSTNVAGNAAVGRFTPTPTVDTLLAVTPQKFPASSPFGAVIRNPNEGSTTNPTGTSNYNAIQSNPQAATSSNREYLPPRRP